LGYEPNELPGCSTPLYEYIAINESGQSQVSVRLRGCSGLSDKARERNFFRKTESAFIGWM
jgi:hypothetical protein